MAATILMLEACPASIAMLGDCAYYREKADEFEARAEAEGYQNIRQAYRKLAADYRKLAEQSVENAPPLVPGQRRML